MTELSSVAFAELWSVSACDLCRKRATSQIDEDTFQAVLRVLTLICISQNNDKDVTDAALADLAVELDQHGFWPAEIQALEVALRSGKTPIH